ncbi:NCS1 family nucleobase:cation symporter-1 [Modestobacter sp. I12A-02662]|uniref:NCS1 family nucleobase:cation symporter-1 n=1 Tax=Modestobacter sp. I12A-02662 TaxID=1730496 RepID=UPI0034E03166
MSGSSPASSSTPGDTIVGPSGGLPGLHGLAEPVPAGVDPRLYNQDLAPTKREGRTWSAYNFFALWANDVHSLGNYAFAIGLFALGLGTWQILTAIGVGAALLFLLLTLSGYMGVKTGVPFPVMSRISFGVRGAQVPALLRGGVAIVWFGIQTYLAALVGNVLLIAVFPSLESLTESSTLGLSHLSWICFSVLWVVQVLIACYGMEMIRHYEAFAGPVILITFVALAVYVFVQAGGSIAWSPPDVLTGSEMWLQILGGGALWVAIYATFVLNFCDFTRGAKSKQAVVLGNLWGIPVNMLFFGLVVVILTGGQLSIDGTVITSPTDVVQAIDSTLFLVLACLALLTLTIAVNLMANFVAPSFALAAMMPRTLNFRRAAIVSGVIGFVILPWNLYNSPAVILYFLGGLGAFLGPLFGIVMADYWLLRRQRINVPDLYTFETSGEYWYRNGVNTRAILALIPSAAIAMVFAFVEGLGTFAAFSWFIAAGLGAVIYYVIADRTRTFADVDGESIAVPVRH